MKRQKAKNKGYRLEGADDRQLPNGKSRATLNKVMKEAVSNDSWKRPLPFQSCDYHPLIPTDRASKPPNHH